MFSSTKKLEPNLREFIKLKPYNNYRVLIKYKRFKDGLLRKVSIYKGSSINHIESCKIISATLNARGIKRLLEYPEIEYICFDEYLFLCGISVNTANKVKLYNKSKNRGKGIGIAIIDSGVFPHIDLTTPFNRISSFTDLINNLQYPYDDNGHGTCIAGVIAGNGKKSNGLYSGIAPESTIYSYKAFDKTGKGYFSDILYAMELVYKDSMNSFIKVLCLPFEFLGYNVFIQNLFQAMTSLINSRNISCILPSGSNKSLNGSITGIALCENCITVSGYDSTSKIKPYTYSSMGTTKKDTKPNLCAACVDIVSLNSNLNYISEKDGNKLYPYKLNSSYKTFTGTSIAAAYIAGVCALIYENNRDLTPKDISSILKAGCEKIEDIPSNCQGYGKIDFKSILK